MGSEMCIRDRRTVDTERGAAYHRKAGVKHNVINGGIAPMAFVEVEMKQ